MSETYLYSINRVINIDNGTNDKNTVFSTDTSKIYKNLNDPAITSQCRIIGGTWTDDLVVHNIVCHPSDEDSGDYGVTNNQLNIASEGNDVNINGKTVTIATVEADNITTINGKTLTMGEDVSTTTLKGTQTVLATAGQASSSTTINGETLTMGEDLSTTTLKGIQTVLATAGQDSSTTINGKTLTIGENDRSDTTTLTAFGKIINIGDDTNTTTLNIYSDSTLIKTDSSLTTQTEVYTLNSEQDGAYLKAQKNVTNGKAQIDIGSSNMTETINIQAQNIDINAQNSLSLSTSTFEFNSSSQKAYFEINDTDSRITIGRSQLDNTFIHGSNVYIGEPGCTTTIYGNVISYSEGSNIVTNTVTEETSAFHIHNTGTKTALTVIQDNQVSGSGYNLVEFYTQSNQDRTPFRVDDVGRVGMGVEINTDLKAWLHINRNDPYISSTLPDDLLLIEDTDNDVTPFIIKKEGDVGIGTSEPKYKLDVWTTGSDLNGQGDTTRSKGIALRDVVYIKQNHTNRIMYALGNKLYAHPAGDFVHTCVTGFTFTWDKNNVAYANSDNNGSDPDDGTFVFRMTCKLHIAGNDGHVAFRRFEIFVNPHNSTYYSSNKQMPAHVTVADMFDSAFEHYEFPVEPVVINKTNNSCELQIKWKLRNTTSGNTMPSTSRAYLDVEFFGHENIGDVKAEPLNAYDIANDGNLTPV
mgnify:CR=1 FL=1